MREGGSAEIALEESFWAQRNLCLGSEVQNLRLKLSQEKSHLEGLMRPPVDVDHVRRGKRNPTSTYSCREWHFRHSDLLAKFRKLPQP